jgi:hypothetical protein
MISAIYKQGQGGRTGRFCTEAAATAHKRLFVNRKSCTSSEVSGEYGIRFDFLIFEQLNRKSNFSEFQPPNPFNPPILSTPQSVLLSYRLWSCQINIQWCTGRIGIIAGSILLLSVALIDFWNFSSFFKGRKLYK